MQTENIERILPIALEREFIRPEINPDPCLVDIINQANFILYFLHLAGRQGLSTQQIANRTGLHPNTCKCYLRVLVYLQLAEKTKEANVEAVWSFKY